MTKQCLCKMGPAQCENCPLVCQCIKWNDEVELSKKPKITLSVDMTTWHDYPELGDPETYEDKDDKI